jgi:hypothetical protein
MIAVLASFGCGSDTVEPPPTPACEQQCQDDTALKALRETMKLVYNLTLQGNPVGEQDESFDCPRGGEARVFGTATSNAEQGATEVDITYELDACGYLRRDEDPDDSYDLFFDGTIDQRGTLAVQPTAASAALMRSDSMSLSGTVWDPPIAYAEEDCAVELGQSGSIVAGTLCGRVAGADL